MLRESMISETMILWVMAISSFIVAGIFIYLIIKTLFQKEARKGGA